MQHVMVLDTTATRYGRQQPSYIGRELDTTD